MLFKSIFIKYRTKFALKRLKINRENISFSGAKNVGVLFTYRSSDQIDIITHFIKELELSGKKVKCLVYRKGKAEQWDNAYEYYNERDFSTLGKIENEYAQHFINAKFDFLFHLDMQANISLDYVLANCHARCRVSGANQNRHEFYDFMIKVEEGKGLDELCKQILHYTKSIINYA